jgi:hypothetical protein
MFADLSENSVLQLIAVVLLMAMFGCAVAVLDHWVSARPRQRASSGRTDGLRTSPVGRAGGARCQRDGDGRRGDFGQVAPHESSPT